MRLGAFVASAVPVSSSTDPATQPARELFSHLSAGSSSRQQQLALLFVLRQRRGALEFEARFGQAV